MRMRVGGRNRVIITENEIDRNSLIERQRMRERERERERETEKNVEIVK